MRHILKAALLVGALTLPISVFAAAPQAAKKTSQAASHSVKGVVKSVDNSSLVISRPGKKGADMTFVLDSATLKEGSPAVGSDVSVRYRTEGKTMVATAVTVQPVKQVASSKPATAKKK